MMAEDDDFASLRAYHPGLAEQLYDGLARAVSFPFKAAGDDPYHARQVGERARDLVKVPLEFLYGPQESEEAIRELAARGMHADRSTALNTGTLALNALPAAAFAKRPLKALGGGLAELLAKYGADIAEGAGAPVTARGMAEGGRVAVETALDAGKSVYDKLAELAERYLKGADDPNMISTRRPSPAGAKTYGDPDQELLLQSGDAMRLKPDAYETNMGLMKEEPFMSGVRLRDPGKVGDEAVRRGADNLKFITNDLMSPETVEAARQWYPTAQKLLGDKAASVGLPPRAGYAVGAVTSPQTAWDINVAKANRLMDMHGQGFDMSADERRRALAWLEQRLGGNSPGAVASRMPADLEHVLHAPMEELATPMDRYSRVVMLDAARNDPKVPSVNVSGEYGAPVGNITWGASNEIDKALQVMRNPSMGNISAQMPGGGKVPSFYNNIAAPYSHSPISTIDTHSAGAGSLFPGGGKDPVVYRAMGLSPDKGLPPAAADSASTGARGLYGTFSDMHELAGKELGMLPREVQSATWEGVRNLWGQTGKTPQLKANIERIWREAPSPDAARYAIAELLGHGLRRSYVVKR